MDNVRHVRVRTVASAYIVLTKRSLAAQRIGSVREKEEEKLAAKKTEKSGGKGDVEEEKCEDTEMKDT